MPPNSRVTFFKLLIEEETIFFPTSVDPVKVILSTSLCFASASPAVSPSPVTIFTTPFGIPDFSIKWPKYNAVKGVSSAGLSTTVHPAARAGASFRIAKIKGEFHGIIAPTTPMGSLFV